MDERANLPLFTSAHALRGDPATRNSCLLELLRLRQSLDLLERNRQDQNLRLQSLNLPAGVLGVGNIPPSLLRLGIPSDALLPITDPLVVPLSNSMRPLGTTIPTSSLPIMSTSTPSREILDDAVLSRLVLGNGRLPSVQDDAVAASLTQLNLLRRLSEDQFSLQATARLIPPSFDHYATSSSLLPTASSPHDLSLTTTMVAPPQQERTPYSNQTNQILPTDEPIRRLENDNTTTFNTNNSSANNRTTPKATSALPSSLSSIRSTTSNNTSEAGDAREAVASGRTTDDSAAAPLSTNTASSSSPPASSLATSTTEGSDHDLAIASSQADMAQAPLGGTRASKADLQWYAMFQRLLAYKAEHGDCLCPQRYKKDPQLGKWVCYQRKCKDTLSKERKQKLDAVGFVFTARQGVESWQSMFCKLVEYKETHGDCLVPQNYPQDKKLGKWVAIQRIYKKTLPKERLKLLKDIGFVWSVNQAHWETMFASLAEFKRVNGHCKPSWNRDQRLANWIQRQRKVKDRLSEDRLLKLRELGLDI